MNVKKSMLKSWPSGFDRLKTIIINSALRIMITLFKIINL